MTRAQGFWAPDTTLKRPEHDWLAVRGSRQRHRDMEGRALSGLGPPPGDIATFGTASQMRCTELSVSEQSCFGASSSISFLAARWASSDVEFFTWHLSTSGGLRESIFEHSRRQEALERAFSSTFDARRLRSEHLRRQDAS